MQFSFPELVAHAAKTRKLCAGTIVGSGTVSNSDRSKGSSCLAEKRMIEIIEQGKPSTPFMRFGDQIIVTATLVEWEYRLRIEYLIVGATSGERLTKAMTVQVAVDMANGQLCLPTPPILLERFG